MSNIQQFRPIGPGYYPDPYLTTPARGFFCTPTGASLWSVIDDPIGSDDQDATYAGWAVTDTNVRVSFQIADFEGPNSAIINYIKVVLVGAGGYNQSNGSEPTPSGSGNNFYIGVRTGSPGANYLQLCTFTVGGRQEFHRYFYTKDGTNYGQDGIQIFRGIDLINLEIELYYGYYWVTDDKDLTINDNYHNVMTQMYAEISWDNGPPLTSSGNSSILLTL